MVACPFCSQVDTPGHKLSRVNQDEQSEILRVPVAMAMTKLLLALPESTLHTHLPRYAGVQWLPYCMPSSAFLLCHPLAPNPSIWSGIETGVYGLV